MKPRPSHCAALLAASLLWAPLLAAQGWVSVGPPGGNVRSLAADPRNRERVYLGTADGILYRSDDAGLRWQRLQPGFPRRGQSLDDIVVDSDGTVLIGFWEVAGSGGGVARSTDGGEHFTILPGIDGQSVRALAQAASDPDTLVAGTMVGVFRSADGGKRWRLITPEGHAELKTVGSVAVDPEDARVIYAGTWHLPWKTADGGRTWVPLHSGMIDDSDVMTLTVDRRDARVLFATACSGIYRSPDEGGRWARIRGIPSSSRRTRAFAQSPDDLATYYAGTTAGLWISNDGAANWRLAVPEDVVINAVVPLGGGVVLLGTDGAGVLRSADNGTTWAAANAGFSERFISRVTFDPRAGKTLAGVWGDRRHGGVFAAASPRGPWLRVGPGLEGREVLSLGVAGLRYLAGTDDGLFMWPGVATPPAPPAPPATRARAGRPTRAAVPPPPPRRPASGPHWQRLAPVLDGVDAHPRVNDIAVLSEQAWLVGTGHGVLKTTDAGRHWRRPAMGPRVSVTALGASPHEPGLVLAATPIGVFRSMDGGERWVLAARGPADAQTHHLAFLPTDAAVVFAATSKGLYRSDDRGESWGRVTGGVPFTDITGLALHPDGQTLYVGDFTWGGVFRTLDGGRTWQRLPAAGLVTDRVWTIALDPEAPDRLLAATPSGGLHLWEAPDTTAAGSAGSQPD